MNSSTDDQKFEEDAFWVKFERYGEWVEAAQIAGSLRESRERTEAVLLWLEEQRGHAPVEICAKIDSIITQLGSAVAALPNPVKIPALPEVAAGEEHFVEVSREIGERAVRFVESQLANLPPEFAWDIRFCLAASKGLRMPGRPLDCHHLFALAIRNIGEALLMKDASQISQAASQLENWSKMTALNDGFDHTEFLRRIKNIITLVGGTEV